MEAVFSSVTAPYSVFRYPPLGDVAHTVVFMASALASSLREQASILEGPFAD